MLITEQLIKNELLYIYIFYNLNQYRSHFGSSLHRSMEDQIFIIPIQQIKELNKCLESFIKKVDSLTFDECHTFAMQMYITCNMFTRITAVTRDDKIVPQILLKKLSILYSVVNKFIINNVKDNIRSMHFSEFEDILVSFPEWCMNYQYFNLNNNYAISIREFNGNFNGLVRIAVLMKSLIRFRLVR